MSANNSISLIGRVANEIEIRKVGEKDNTKATFRLAVKRPYKKDEADFFNIVVWGKLAEICGKYLTKGKQISVQGYLQVRSFQNEDGSYGNFTEIVVDDIEFLGKKEDNA